MCGDVEMLFASFCINSPSLVYLSSSDGRLYLNPIFLLLWPLSITSLRYKISHLNGSGLFIRFLMAVLIILYENIFCFWITEAHL